MKIIIINKKIFFNYYILKIYEAGIVLLGWEVKSIKLKNVQIKNSYIFIKNNEIFIKNMYINLLKNIKINNKNNPKRIKKLLINIKEIYEIKYKMKIEKYTIVILNIHLKKKFIKCDIALVKGKKKYEKNKKLKINF